MSEVGEQEESPKDRPTVSIGMPAYNGERFVEAAIESLLSQTFEDFELLVVDNRSTDRTYEISLSLAARDSRVRCIRQRENYGHIKNFNTAFRLTSGRYFKWAAVDDLCAPDFLARCVEVLDDDPSVVLAYPEMPNIDEKGNPFEPQRLAFDPSMLDKTASPDPVVRFDATMRNLWYTEHLYGLIRATALAQTGLHPYHWMGDHILLAELSLHGRFHRIPEPLLYLRRHRQQTSKAPRAEQRLTRVYGETRHGILPGLAQYPKRVYLHVSSVRRAPIDRGTRMHCFSAIVRSTVRWVRLRMLRA